MKAIKVYADWCAPCKVLTKTLSEMENLPEIENVNIDGNIALATRYSVRSVPTILIVDDDGNELKRITGNQPREKLEEFFSV